MVLPAPFGPIMPTISPLATRTTRRRRRGCHRTTRPSPATSSAAMVCRGAAAVDRTGDRTRWHGDVGEEHRTQQIGPVQQIGRRAGEADRAALHEVGPLGQRRGDVDALLDQDDRDTVVCQATHERQQLADDHRRQAQRQLVDQQHPRLGDERHAEREHLLLAAAEICGRRQPAARAARGTSSTPPRSPRRPRRAVR